MMEDARVLIDLVVYLVQIIRVPICGWRGSGLSYTIDTLQSSPQTKHKTDISYHTRDCIPAASCSFNQGMDRILQDHSPPIQNPDCRGT